MFSEVWPFFCFVTSWGLDLWCLGAVSRPLGGPLESLWEASGPLGAHVGGPWALLGSTLEVLGLSWGPLGSCLVHLGVILEEIVVFLCGFRSFCFSRFRDL